jgi:hypothetical protein
LRAVKDGHRRQPRTPGAVRFAQPYQGKLGVVEQDALADLLVNCNPDIANIKLTKSPEKNFVVITIDGVIHKSTGQSLALKRIWQTG